MIRTAIVLSAGVLLLAGCGGSPAPEPTPPPQAHRPVPPPPRGGPHRDECGAHDLQTLVGRPRSEIPVPVIPSLQRVACTNCPVTQDYNPRRLNFFFDPQSGLIREVSCG